MAGNGEDLSAATRFEIAVLIKNVVSRQKGLECPANWLSAFQESGGIEERFAASFVAIDIADEKRRLADAVMQTGNGFEVLRDEARLEDEILRRITGCR